MNGTVKWFNNPRKVTDSSLTQRAMMYSYTTQDSTWKASNHSKKAQP